MSKGSMNVKAAFVHNLTDAGASLAVLAGGAAIYWLDWTWVDPTLTILIAGYILYLSFGMLKRTAGILMEGTPEGLDLGDVQQEIERFEGVRSLHHLHVWELDESSRALEAHVVIADSETDRGALRKHLKDSLRDKFRITHATIELENASASCDDSELIPDH